jgi:DNA-binding CsgD family transcriptional regulator
MYYALAADLIASRNAPARPELSVEIERALAGAAADYAGEWLAPPVTARGLDEVSAVLLRPTHAFDVAVRINETVWPSRFRFALASGGIDIAADTGDAAAMDGPAFHRAADAIAKIDASGDPLGLDLDGAAPESAEMAMCLARLHAELLRDRTKAQHGVVRTYRRLETQQAVAAEMGIAQQTVSDHLRRARFDDLRRIEDVLRSWLESITTDRGAA